MDKTYEYILVLHTSINSLQNALNSYGEKGFKFVGIFDGVIILMREVESEEDFSYHEEI